MRHVIVHQFDPTRPVPAGIDGYIRDFVTCTGSSYEFEIVGVTTNRLCVLGQTVETEVGGRRVAFTPVAYLDRALSGRRVPHALRLALGVLRYRPPLNGCIVHVHRAEIGLALAMLYPRARFVQFLHGSGREALQHKRESYWRFAPAAYRLVERLAVKRARKTIVMHAEAAAELSRRGYNVAWGSNWYDPKVFVRAGDHACAWDVGWAARFEAQKDPLCAVEVFRLLAARSRPFTAWMAGSGSLMDSVRTQLREFNLENQVELLGNLNAQELADRFQRTHVFLSTSLWEGMPRVVLEALACGVPVVATNVGDLERILTHPGGELTFSRSASHLADLVESVRARTCRDTVAKSVRDFEMGTVVPRLVESLASLEGER